MTLPDSVPLQAFKSLAWGRAHLSQPIKNATTTNLTKQQATDIISQYADGKRLLKNGKVQVLGSIDEAPAHVLEQAKRSEVASDKPTQAEIAQAQRDLNTQLAIADKLEAEYGYLPAPNGEKSNLNKQQWAQVRTPQFKEFYGDWEKNGKQLGVYRGSEESNDWRGVVGGSQTIATTDRGAIGGNSARGSGVAGFTDGNGEPVVFYHGTSDDVVAFDTNHENRKDKG